MLQSVFLVILDTSQVVSSLTSRKTADNSLTTTKYADQLCLHLTFSAIKIN